MKKLILLGSLVMGLNAQDLNHFQQVFYTDFSNTKTELKYPSNPMRFFTNKAPVYSKISSNGNPSMFITSDPLNKTNKVIAFPLKYTDDINYRTEIKIESFPEFKFNKEYIINFKIFIPSNWIWDNLPDMIMQIHARADKNEFSRNPPIGIEIQNDEFKLIVYSDANIKTVTNIFSRKHKYSNKVRVYKLGKIIRNQWHNFKLHFKYSFLNDGYLNLYLDNKLLIEDKGANCFNDNSGGYLKLGNYKYSWKRKKSKSVTQRLHYADDINIWEK